MTARDVSVSTLWAVIDGSYGTFTFRMVYHSCPDFYCQSRSRVVHVKQSSRGG